MLKIDRQHGGLTAYSEPEFARERLAGRHKLDDLLVESPDVFFAEVGRPLFLLGRLADFDPSAERSILFAADPSGRVFVVAVQDESGAVPDLVDTLQVAESISGWAGPDILACMAPAAAQVARERLQVSPQALNREQGVILVAESVDPDALATSAWLAQRYGVSASCVRVSMSRDQISSDEFLRVEDLGSEAEALYLSGWADTDPTPWPDTVPDISDGSADIYPATTEKAQPRTDLKAAHASAGAPDWEAQFQAAMDEPASVQPVEPETVTAETDIVEEEPHSSPDAEATVITPSSDPSPAHTPAQLPDLVPPLELDDDFEDPLADVIEAREHAEAAASEPHEPGSERREAERSNVYQARRLRLNYFGRLLGARLIDFSDKGIGVEALSPLPVGAEIGVSGELVSDEKVVALEGRARVRHSKPNQDGVCRIGFSIDPNAIKELDTPEAFERR